jgi:hypothetical protein
MWFLSAAILLELCLLAAAFYFMFIWVNPNVDLNNCNEGNGCPGAYIGLSILASLYLIFCMFMIPIQVVLWLGFSVFGSKSGSGNQTGGRRRR